MSDSFQTQRHIQSLLAGAGLLPKHRYGQHFLIDRNLMMRLVDSAEIGPADTVIEVGTGTGSLTRLLASRGKQVYSFDIDRELIRVAEAELAGVANVVLHCEDA